MSVRAKFKVVRVEASQQQHQKEGATSFRSEDMETVEMRTIVLNPVFSNGDPEHENTKFWRASPSGEIKLGTVNPEAWGYFDLGVAYYIDFVKAE